MLTTLCARAWTPNPIPPASKSAAPLWTRSPFAPSRSMVTGTIRFCLLVMRRSTDLDHLFCDEPLVGCVSVRQADVIR
jgi:hypothetical protein